MFSTRIKVGGGETFYQTDYNRFEQLIPGYSKIQLYFNIANSLKNIIFL